MVRRKKTRLERLLSFNRHRKRWGAWRHTVAAVDLSAMRTRIIDVGEAVQTHRTERSLDQHLSNLRCEFSGQSELAFYHAKLIVFIRREVRPADSFRQFNALWMQEAEFLCQNLNLRWLISAADTFVDLSPEPRLRAVGMMASLLGNTIKITESDRYIHGGEELKPQQDRVDDLQVNQVPLFDGTTVFAVGREDTLRNMYWRLEPFFSIKPVGLILEAVYNRMQEHDTAYARLRTLHYLDRTRWWNDTT